MSHSWTRFLVGSSGIVLKGQDSRSSNHAHREHLRWWTAGTAMVVRFSFSLTKRSATTLMSKVARKVIGPLQITFKVWPNKAFGTLLFQHNSSDHCFSTYPCKVLTNTYCVQPCDLGFILINALFSSLFLSALSLSYYIYIYPKVCRSNKKTQNNGKIH